MSFFRRRAIPEITLPRSPVDRGALGRIQQGTLADNLERRAVTIRRDDPGEVPATYYSTGSNTKVYLPSRAWEIINNSGRDPSLPPMRVMDAHTHPKNSTPFMSGPHATASETPGEHDMEAMDSISRLLRDPRDYSMVVTAPHTPGMPVAVYTPNSRNSSNITGAIAAQDSYAPEVMRVIKEDRAFNDLLSQEFPSARKITDEIKELEGIRDYYNDLLFRFRNNDLGNIYDENTGNYSVHTPYGRYEGSDIDNVYWNIQKDQFNYAKRIHNNHDVLDQLREQISGTLAPIYNLYNAGVNSPHNLYDIELFDPQGKTSTEVGTPFEDYAREVINFLRSKGALPYAKGGLVDDESV